MKIYIPEDVQSVISDLEKHGFSAYIVGGCVRDAILGITPHDYDICTSATPDEMQYAFKDRDIIETGLKHGTITVKGMDDFYEVTTYRIDGEYKDGRHPEEVVFVDNIEEDLSRRDFTINAMAYNSKTGLIDPFNGRHDLCNKIIRCVGNANKRFEEDALRILRALRFASRFGFSIEQDTDRAIFSKRNLLHKISYERINSEFSKILLKANTQMLCDYKDVFAEFIPEIKPCFYFDQHNPHHIYDVYTHIAHSVASVNTNFLDVKLALFLHDIAKPLCFTMDDNSTGHFYGHAAESADIAKNVLARLKYDNETTKNVLTLVENHDILLSGSEKQVRKLLNKFGKELLEKLLLVQYGDKSAQSNNKDSRNTFEMIDKTKILMSKIIEKNECLSLKDLHINGNDLIKMGIKQGKEIGYILNSLLEDVLENPEHNQSDYLQAKATEIMEKQEDRNI